MISLYVRIWYIYYIPKLFDIIEKIFWKKIQNIYQNRILWLKAVNILDIYFIYLFCWGGGFLLVKCSSLSLNFKTTAEKKNKKMLVYFNCFWSNVIFVVDVNVGLKLFSL